MIISPPFLPARAAGATDEVWINAAMPAPASRLKSTNAPEGSFPLSNELGWHNGMHIAAPASQAVRAIADGKVIFVNKPIAANSKIDDAQNYNPFDADPSKPTAAWTDNGCIILEHKTEIGAQGATATEVTYYSLYMHLSDLARVTPPGQTVKRLLQTGDNVWRKDEIGTTGQVYGNAGQIHFEICMNQPNLQILIGKPPAWSEPATATTPITPPTADGRTDSVFGSLYFYLPANTPTATTPAMPTTHLRATAAPATTLGSPLWVKMDYNAGHCTFTSYNASGTLINALGAETDAEYNLYKNSLERHNTLSATEKATSSPSGWYELLRFGRNIGRGPADADKDLLPATAAHWRKIANPAGTAVWADLNASGSFKFSDADFLALNGWNCVNDDTSATDQRCDSVNLQNLIRDPDETNSKRMEVSELSKRLGIADVQAKLKRTICQFPSEWDKVTVSARYDFVNKMENFKAAKASGNDMWPKLETHLKAISFDGLPVSYAGADWRCHPKEFILLMRNCGWLSGKELAQCLPRKSLSASDLTWDSALTRATEHKISLNRYFRKYNGESKYRLIHSLAQIYIETGILGVMNEGGIGNDHPYKAFYGRGFMQLTWADNYRKYGEFKNLTNHTGAYLDTRITATSTHPKDSGGVQMQWSPRYDPKIISGSNHNGESSGFYWVTKSFRGQKNMNRVCDLPYSATTVAFNCWLVNGGGNGYAHRQQFAKYLENMLLDSPLIDGTKAFTYPPFTPNVNLGTAQNPNWTPLLCSTYPPTEVAYSLNGTVHYDYQRP